MALLSYDGKSVPEIALMLKRNQHTIRDWLKRYRARGINGLSRNFSPGRPNTMRKKIKQYIEWIIGSSPINHGYQNSTGSFGISATMIVRDRIRLLFQ
jgi:transposase